MFIDHIGVSIGYLIVVFLLCWFVVLSRGRVAWKILAITFSVFYAVALYMYLPKIEGYPTGNEIPEGSILISVKVEEPTVESDGAFYLWCNPKPNLRKKALSLFTPGGFLAYTGHAKPRVYMMPYDRELHKKLLEQQKKAQKVGGFLVVNKKRGGKKGKQRLGEGRDTQEKIKFKVINPVEVLTKEQQ
jgi:hypothetical protein